MDSLSLGSGDNNNSPRLVEGDKPNTDEINIPERENDVGKSDITPQMIEDNESKLKDRIAQCRNIIKSLKIELSMEKSKLEKDSKTPEVPSVSETTSDKYEVKKPHTDFIDICSSNNYSACIDSKLSCDESIIEYEKQLQKYQNTLNMAQIEKKNAIRKQMLAKAYRLKLLEVENQCNIELLRVKQSLQCLEPLHMIANKWKTESAESSYDLNNYELIPRFPELSSNSGSDLNSFREEGEFKASPEKSGICGKEDSSASDCAL